jgi:hypothetical protein
MQHACRRLLLLATDRIKTYVRTKQTMSVACLGRRKEAGGGAGPCNVGRSGVGAEVGLVESVEVRCT